MSDSHDAGETSGPTSSPIGIGSTAVLAEELSETAVECGVEAGHTYAKVTGAGGPDVRMEARPPGFTGAPATFGDTVRAGSAGVHREGHGRLRAHAARDQGRPDAADAVPVSGDPFRYAFTASDPGRYRLQVQRGQTIETVSTPIYLAPGRGTVSTRDCTPLGVRGKANRRMRPRRQRYLTRCTATGGDVKECAVTATITTGRRGRRRTLATGRVAHERRQQARAAAPDPLRPAGDAPPRPQGPPRAPHLHRERRRRGERHRPPHGAAVARALIIVLACRTSRSS